MVGAQTANDMAAVQRSFARAVLTPGASAPEAIDPRRRQSCRFDVYRNNVVVSLINALAARYPVVRRLLWDDVFQAVARIYISKSPPLSPVLLEYGDGFPEFIRDFGDGPSRSYVADIAELETARVRAYHAADVEPLGTDAFAKIDPARLVAMRVKFHPSVTLLKSCFPVVTIWETQQSDEPGFIREWKPEAALIVRPDWDVEVRRLPEGGYEFLAALAAGDTVGAAMERAMACAPNFDLAASLAVLIASIVIEIVPPV